ncbi:hypothetical protein CRYUN_Cryun09bG0195300 [Craigia yunnanensis]
MDSSMGLAKPMQGRRVKGAWLCAGLTDVTNTDTGYKEKVRIVDACGSGDLELDLVSLMSQLIGPTTMLRRIAVTTMPHTFPVPRWMEISPRCGAACMDGLASVEKSVLKYNDGSM